MMRRRLASSTDLPIFAARRKFRWEAAGRKAPQREVCMVGGHGRLALALAVGTLALALPASVRCATASDDVQARRLLRAYIQCGADYVSATPGPTPDNAELTCAPKLGEYVDAVRDFNFRIAFKRGKSPEQSRAYAAARIEPRRQSALKAFRARVMKLLEQGGASH
jgi:hypothetical protein